MREIPDPLQFAYLMNRLSDDRVTLGVQSILLSLIFNRLMAGWCLRTSPQPLVQSTLTSYTRSSQRWLLSAGGSPVSWPATTDEVGEYFEEIVSKCQQRIYLPRLLNSFRFSKDILHQFYYSFVKSIITFSVTYWCHSISTYNRDRLQWTVSVCSKIIGLPIRSLWIQWSTVTASCQ